MAEAFADFAVGIFQGKVPSELIVFLISMLPVVELRGGMIAAKLLEVDFWPAFFICYVGNLLPLPFILLFIRRIFDYLRHKKGFQRLIEKLEIRSARKSEKAMRWKGLGLLLFVAVPLPGTGGWTGALIAALMDMRIKSSLPIIAVGILIANLIMSAISYGLLGALGIGG